VAALVSVRPIGLPTIAALTVAIVGVSSSAPLIAYAAAPALAIAFWRNALAVAVITPVAVTRGRRQLAALRSDRRTVAVCVAAGVALAAHFAAWVPSAKLTSVATATALVSTMPVWSALIATGQSRWGRPDASGRRTPRPAGTTWLGIAIAVLGAALATGADVSFSSRAVLGDVLALAGGMAAAVYTAFSERARRTLSTTTYTTVCYGVCALVLGAGCLVGGVRMVGFAVSAWLAIVGITVGAQLLGHSMISYALHRVPATTVGVLLLLEVPGAALLGWLLLDQVPRAESVPGLVVIILGVAVVVLGAARRGRQPTNSGGQPTDSGGQPTNGGTAISPDAIATT